ncbi:hypothetical protein B4919_09205 [Francisella tularensis subsp. novicida]|uniref:hypothetical protein n=1 Tax=Francisella tularensis TaxID=263 RepID=UPI000CE2B5BB|nr:hypothetical protein [Francisella tularensis]AVC44946.1 hypothetical protein B4919_09205 [Francisella tularensis subsp. novicida]
MSYSVNISNIKKAQKEYLELIIKYEEIMLSDTLSQNQVIMMIEEIQCFWLDRKDILLFELEGLSLQKEIFWLAGALYLDIEDKQHYLFKTLGEFHIVSDPLLKMENFFRVPVDMFDIKSLEIFKRSFIDVLKLETTLQDYFYILPLNLFLSEDQNEHQKLLKKYFISFINAIFTKKFTSLYDFINEYNSYEEIENDMVQSLKDSVVFAGIYEKSTLREKILGYIEIQPAMKVLFDNKFESEIFIISLQGLVYQVIDMLIISSKLNINPFIRKNELIRYLVLVKESFCENQYFKTMIEKTILFYVLSSHIDEKITKKISFVDFTKYLENKDLLGVILQKLRVNNINILEEGLVEAREIAVKALEEIINL